MNFSSGPRRKICYLCKQPIDVMAPKVEIQRQTVHKECFRCCICEEHLLPGYCAMDDGLCQIDFLFNHFGPLWFCHKHMMLGSGEKLEMLKQKMRNAGINIA
uniref:LIM zinc-binding domain-containing protein n=1 Tax=Acrobeloides nanus TaxID=290746 RepID=A0A914E155_9BILA